MSLVSTCPQRSWQAVRVLGVMGEISLMFSFYCTGSHVASAGLKLTKEVRMALNICSPCLYLSGAGFVPLYPVY